MLLKKLKPTSSGVRHKLLLTKNLLSKTNKVLKLSQKCFKTFAGRSSLTGHITTRHQGGGVKQSFRFVNFRNFNTYYLVLAILYDPKRSSFISLNYDLIRQSFSYTLAINFVYPGSLFYCTDVGRDLKLGCRTLLRYIPAGSLVNSLSKNYESKSIFIRAAGTYGQLIQKSVCTSTIKLPSGLLVYLPNTAYATLGCISNPQSSLVVWGKAGTTRLRGGRPSVRGIAMNPVDHPHGGRTNGGMVSMTPWGKPTRGKPTAKKV